MFDSYNEAVATLNVRPRAQPRNLNALEMSFANLTVKQSENFVRVALRQTDVNEEQPACPFAKDLSLLAELLHNDSRVVLDFEGVEQFSAASVESLKTFYRQLKSKGSRLVLCNIEPSVKPTFYPARLPR